VDYGIVDIDRDPGTQGVERSSVDLVVAANVLHDAKHLDQSLRHLASALRPGGVLLLIEGTANSLVQMISVGFIEGLGNHQDQRALPLLSVPQWQQRLRAAGFARSAAIPAGEPAVDVHVQHVLVAGTPPAPAGPDAGSLRQALEARLPDYLVPRHVVVVDRLPRNANGKVDRSGLPSPWSGPAPDERVAPRNDLERELFRMWREALGRDDFGVRDNFFELGGDSLHAVSILGRIREQLVVDISADDGLELLFDRPTIADLAAVLGDRAGG
jgi:acyl carrier protein